MGGDIEKGHVKPESSSQTGSHEATTVDVQNVEFYDPSQESVWTRLGVTAESFKRAPGTTGGQVIETDDPNFDPNLHAADNPMLQQKLKPRHLQMIAVGGSIGTGLFIGSGGALSTGGPGALLIAWGVMGFMLLMTVQAMGEMAIMYPVSGGFYTLAGRFLDNGWAFGMGWLYVLQWAVTLPVELTAAGFTMQYWTKDVPIAVWMTVFWLAIIILNVFGTLGYAEEEFFASALKLIVVIIFIILGIVLNCGGGPSSGEYGSYVGGKYYHDPGAFAAGFKGVCAVFVTAAFSFSGTELVGLAAAETPNPRKTMPSAIKNTFWRITIIYILSLLVIGLNVPYNDPNLLGGSYDANTSPFVRMIDLAHISGLNHLVNATITVSVLSIGLSCVYGGSRTLTALAEQGYAPRIFTYVDKAGRPLWSVIFLLAWGAISYVNTAAAGSEVFDWLLAVSGLSALFTWGSIMMCHIRFRKAWRVQGHSIDELPFRAIFGVTGSWIGLILIVLVFIAQFYTAIWPVGEKGSAETFFKAYLALPIVLALWIGGYIWKRERPRRSHEIDLDTGRKVWDSAEKIRAIRAARRQKPWYVRLYIILFSG